MDEDIKLRMIAGADLHASIFDDKEGYEEADPKAHREFVRGRNRSLTVSRIAEQALRLIEVRPGTGACHMDEYSMKFAELLVNEAADVARKCIEDEWFDVGHSIEQHFGFDKED